MTEQQLLISLANEGLILIKQKDDYVAVGKREFANPMMFFNPNMTRDEYGGTVPFKAINAGLFSYKEIIAASKIVNEFLMTPLDKREIMQRKGASE